MKYSGQTLRVEETHGRGPRGSDAYGGAAPYGGGSRYPASRRTNFSVEVEGLPSDASWQVGILI